LLIVELGFGAIIFEFFNSLADVFRV